MQGSWFLRDQLAGMISHYQSNIVGIRVRERSLCGDTSRPDSPSASQGSLLMKERSVSPGSMHGLWQRAVYVIVFFFFFLVSQVIV